MKISETNILLTKGGRGEIEITASGTYTFGVKNGIVPPEGV